MDQTINYADILTRVIHEEGKLQPSFQPELKIVASCDRETGQFLLMILGWDKNRWCYNTLFHAQLINGKVSVEVDNTEDIRETLMEEGVRAEDFVTSTQRRKPDALRIAA